jgi:hypothetical protein
MAMIGAKGDVPVLAPPVQARKERDAQRRGKL